MAVSALTTIMFPGLSSATYGYGCGEYGYGYTYEYCAPTTGHLIVIKHVVKDNGGTAVASDFTMTINGVTATGGNAFAGAESPGVDKEVTPGSYTVTETGPSGYTASFSTDCSGTIAAGDTKTCTVTNDDQPGSITVIKHVINNDGKHATASNFSMRINGVTVTGTNPFAGSESGTTRSVNAGSYSVTETGPTGYFSTFSSDCSGTIAVGQSKTCTVVNNDIGPRRSPGSWKTHLNDVAPLLPITLGNYTVATTNQAKSVFNAMNCSSTTMNQAIGCLAAELLTAKLNLANGQSTCISPTVTKADNFLKGLSVTAGGVTATGVNYIGPSGTYNLSSAQRSIAITLANALDKYNNNTGCANP